MFSNYYSFSREESDDIQYTFSTEYNRAVFVSFSPNTYDEHLEEFPTLLEHGYSFGILSKKFSKDLSNNDDLIFYTIYQIIKDFVSDDIEKTTVMLYHCDTSDGRGASRDKLFSNWEKKVEETSLFKYSVQVEVPVPGENVTKTHYVGFITFTENPNIHTVKEEFEQFCYHIVQPKDSDLDLEV